MALWRLATFIAGTTALCILSRFAGDPAWDVGVSLLMAVATFLTAPTVVDTWVRQRRVTARSVVFGLGSTSATFHVYQLWRTGSLHLDWFAGNLAGSSVLYLAAGVVWNLSPREPRHWLAAGGAAAVGLACLTAWTTWS